MRVAFSAAVLEDASVHRYLTQIFWMCVDGRHHWVVENEHLIQQSAWFKNEGANIQLEIANQLNTAKPRNSKRPLILVSKQHLLSKAQWELEPEEACEFLSRPVSVFVENLNCDGTFFRVVMLRVGEKKLRRSLGQDVLQMLKAKWTTPEGVEKWFRLEHGGGSSLAMRIRVRCQSSGRVPPSIFSYVDSDKKYPTDDLGQTAKDAKQAHDEVLNTYPLDSWTPELFILEKREVENYIPVAAIRAQTGMGKQRAVNIYDKGLSETQKAHYDLKGGFTSALVLGKKGEAPSADPTQWTWKNPQQQALYQSLSSDELRGLRDGIESDIWEALKQDTHVHEASLRESAGDKGKELDKLIDMALELL